MRCEEVEGLIGSHSKWFGSGMRLVQQGDAVLIVTPVLNRDNDCMSVLLGESPDGGYALTDLGETIGSLEMSGFDLSSGKMAEEVERVLRGLGVSKTDDGEIFVRASREDVPMRLDVLLRAMAAVDGLPNTQDS